MPLFLTNQTYGSGANLVSPALTGTPTAPTAPAGTSTTQVATTAFVLQNADMLMPLSQATIAITGATTAAFGRMHVCSGTTANYTVTLPNPTGNAGKFLGFLMAPATGVTSPLTKLVTLAQYDTTTHTDKIDGQNTRVLWANESATLYCDGTNWIKVAGKSIPMAAYLFLGSGTVSIPNNASTAIPMKSVIADNTGLMADVANGRINVLRAANYACASLVTINNSSPGYTGGATAYVLQNGGGTIAGGLFYFAGPSYPVAQTAGTLAAAAGDLLQAAGYQSSGQTLATAGNAASQNYLTVTELVSW